MPPTTRTVRHTDIVAVLGPRGFEPVRGVRDAISRPRTPAVLDDASMARAIRDGVAKGMAAATAKLAKANRDAGINHPIRTEASR